LARKLVVSTYVQYIVIALFAVLLFGAVRQISGVLLTFIFAGVLAYALNPLVRMLEHRRVPRFVAVIGSFLVLIGVVVVSLVALVFPAVDQVTTLAQNPQQVADAFLGVLDRARELPYVGQQIGRQIDQGDPQAFVRLAERAAPSPGAVLNVTTGLVGSVFGLLLNLVLAVIIAAYLLLDRERIGRGTMSVVPETIREQTVELFHAVEGSLVKYVRGQVLLCLIMGVIGWAIMRFAVGPQYAIVIGLLVGFTELIPVIGAFLGAVPAVLVALVVPEGGFVSALVVAGLFLVAQQLEGNILVPRIQGGSTGVHPLWVLFAVSAATALYGLVGAIFAVPIVAIVAATVRYLNSTLVFERWHKAPLSPLPPGDEEPASITEAAEEATERPGGERGDERADGRPGKAVGPGEEVRS
jgi:predicted PurR-regulated permease PerM